MTSIRTFGGGVRFWRPHKHPRDRNGRFIDTPDFYARSVAYHPSSSWSTTQPWQNLPNGTRQDNDMAFPLVHMENGAPVLGDGWFDLPIEVRKHAFYAAAAREAHLTIPSADLEALFGDAPNDNILENSDITSLNGLTSRSEVIAEAYAILSDGDAVELDDLIPGLAPLVRREALAKGMAVDGGVIAPPDLEDPRFAEGMAPHSEEVPEIPDASPLRLRDLFKPAPGIDPEILAIQEHLKSVGPTRWKLALASGYVGDWGQTGLMAKAFHDNGITLGQIQDLTTAVGDPRSWKEWLTGKGFVVETEGLTGPSPVNLTELSRTFPDLENAYWGALGQISDVDEGRFRVRGTDGSVYRFPPFDRVRDVTPEKHAERIARMVNPAIPVDHQPPLDAHHWLKVAFLGKIPADTSASRMEYRSAGFDTEAVGGNGTSIIGAEPLWDGLNAVGVDPQDADNMALTYAGLQASFPLHGFSGVAGLDHSVWKMEKAKDSGLIAWADPNGIFGVDPNGVRAHSLAGNRPGFFAVPTAEGVITHEFAHVLFAGSATPQLYLPDRADEVASFALERANKAIADKHGIVSPWAAARRLSGYAMASPQEGHAELFNAYVHRTSDTPEWVSTWGDAFVDGYQEAQRRTELPEPSEYYLELNDEPKISGMVGTRDIDRVSAIADHFAYAESLVRAAEIGAEDPTELTETAKTIEDLIADRMKWTETGPVSYTGSFYTGKGTLTMPFSTYGTTRLEVDASARDDFKRDSLDALTEVTVAMGGTHVELVWPYGTNNDPIPNLDLSAEDMESLLFGQLGLENYEGELDWESNNLQDLFDNNAAVRDAAALRGEVRFKFRVADAALLTQMREYRRQQLTYDFEGADTTPQERQTAKFERVYGAEFKARVLEEQAKLGDTPPLVQLGVIAQATNSTPAETFNDVFRYKFNEHWQGSGVMKDGRPFHWSSHADAVDDKNISVKVEFYDDETEALVGTSDRILQYGTNPPRVLHSRLEFPDTEYQGQGMGYQYNRANDAWYLANGFKEIEVSAGLSEGGYAWASDFFEFDDSDTLDDIYADIAGKSRRILDNPKATKAETISALQAQIDLDFFEQRANSTGREVSAWETAHVGWHPDVAETRNWIGRTAMQGTRWHGTKHLAEFTPDIDIPRPEDYDVGIIDIPVEPGSRTWALPGELLGTNARAAQTFLHMNSDERWKSYGANQVVDKDGIRFEISPHQHRTGNHIEVKLMSPNIQKATPEVVSDIAKLLHSWGSEINSKSGNSAKWKDVVVSFNSAVHPQQADILEMLGDGAGADKGGDLVLPIAP